MIQRLKLGECCGIVVDVQSFFLQSLPEPKRLEIAQKTLSVANFLIHLSIPTLLTLERPIASKGASLPGISGTVILEKDFFDLTKEKQIRDHVASLNRNQVILFGCETDVCILQSCLGLLELGYEVFVIEDLLFSSTKNADAALERMRSAGAVLLSYKSMFHELLEAQESSTHRQELAAKFGAFPSEIPDA